MPQPAGELDKRLTLQRQAPKGDRGRSVGDWVDVKTVYAKVETVSGGGPVVAGQGYSATQVRVTIRLRSDVRHGMRFFYAAKGEAFYIANVDDPDRKNETMVCVCSTIPPSQSPAEG